MNMPANDTTSNQYFLLTHLYQFFGSLLGCSDYGMPGFSAYEGFPSMYTVHKFMDLDVNEVGYFIQQVGLAAESFGVTAADATAVGMALNSLFGYRCAPNATAIAAQGPQQQSICIADSCPLANGSVCSAYATPVEPKNATSSSNSTSTGTGSSSSPTSTIVQASASFTAVNVGSILAVALFAMAMF